MEPGIPQWLERRTHDQRKVSRWVRVPAVQENFILQDQHSVLLFRHPFYLRVTAVALTSKIPVIWPKALVAGKHTGALLYRYVVLN